MRFTVSERCSEYAETKRIDECNSWEFTLWPGSCDLTLFSTVAEVYDIATRRSVYGSTVHLYAGHHLINTESLILLIRARLSTSMRRWREGYRNEAQTFKSKRGKQLFRIGTLDLLILCFAMWVLLEKPFQHRTVAREPVCLKLITGDPWLLLGCSWMFYEQMAINWPIHAID